LAISHADLNWLDMIFHQHCEHALGGLDEKHSNRAARTRGTAEDQVIPVTEEQLKVGKRDVSHGRIRVRSYVVEEPVQERVNLHEERVQVERRPVDRPATGDEKLFQNRTIEAEEHAEEAVVEKRARVKEELTVRKEQDQRSKVVSDNVRRTEVELEDERTQNKSTERRR
jgi:uncharacterized protein (TIGR02271 family)